MVQAVRSSELLAAPPRVRPCCALAPRRPRLPAARLRAAVGGAPPAPCCPLLLNINPFAARRTQVLKRYFTPASAAVAEAALVRVVTGRSAERGGLSPVASAGPGSPGARARASRACTEPAVEGRLPVDFPPSLPISSQPMLCHHTAPCPCLRAREVSRLRQAVSWFSAVRSWSEAELPRPACRATLPGPRAPSSMRKPRRAPSPGGARLRSRARRRRRCGADPERGGRPAQPRGGRRGARGRLRAQLAAQRARRQRRRARQRRHRALRRRLRPAQRAQRAAQLAALEHLVGARCASAPVGSRHGVCLPAPLPHRLQSRGSQRPPSLCALQGLHLCCQARLWQPEATGAGDCIDGRTRSTRTRYFQACRSCRPGP